MHALTAPPAPATRPSEAALFDVILRDLVDTVPEPPRGRGRPPIPLPDRLFATIQKVYTTKSMRRATDAYERATAAGHLARVPFTNLPSRVLTNSSMTPILQDLLLESALPVRGIEKDWGFDSTHFRTQVFENREPTAQQKLKTAQKVLKEKLSIEEQDLDKITDPDKVRLTLRAHVAVGMNTHVIAGLHVAELIGEGVGDSSHFRPLLKELHEAGFDIANVYGDKAYHGYDNFLAAQEIGATPWLLFTKTDTIKKRGVLARTKSYRLFQSDPEAFLRRAHKRNNVESANRAVKQKFRRVLRSIDRTAMENEILCMAIGHNITMLIREIRRAGINPAGLIGKILAPAELGTVTVQVPTRKPDGTPGPAKAVTYRVKQKFLVTERATKLRISKEDPEPHDP